MPAPGRSGLGACAHPSCAIAGAVTTRLNPRIAVTRTSARARPRDTVRRLRRRRTAISSAAASTTTIRVKAAPRRLRSCRVLPLRILGLLGILGLLLAVGLGWRRRFVVGEAEFEVGGHLELEVALLGTVLRRLQLVLDGRRSSRR